MSLPAPSSRPSSRRRVGAAAAALVALTGGVVATSTIGSASAAGPASAGRASAAAAATMAPGRGEDDFGMTRAFFRGHRVGFTYSHGFYCDTSVASKATSRCEAGEKWKKAPSADHDPLFITVPLGFKPSKMVDCPAGLTCVDHPMTIDLSRLEKALKPLYPQYTDAQLTEALGNTPTPEHDHFITTRNGGKREWWDVYVVGVTSRTVYNRIHRHESYAYIRHLIAEKNKAVVGPIPTNLFLFFSVQR
ncbi:hypothetical protein GCM10027596_11090 [Nocardioides korecus]